MGTGANTVRREPWNKGKIVGQKAPFKIRATLNKASFRDAQ